MDIAGLAIAVFDELFQICKFITQMITDAAHQDKDFRKLEFEFTHHQVILATFGRRFIEGKLIHELEDCWVIQIKRILEELKKAVGEYTRLAAKYNKNYKNFIKDDTAWWKLGGHSQKKTNREDLRLEATDGYEPTKPSSKSLGLRNRLSKKITQFEWALFDRQKLEDVVNDQRSWLDKLLEVMTLTLLPLPRFSNDVGQLKELGKDAKTLGFSKLLDTRLLILDPTQGGQATEIAATSITFSSVQPPVSVRKTRTAEVLLSNATLGGSEVLIEYKRYLRDNDQMDLGVTKERIRFLSKLLSVVGDKDEEITHAPKAFNLHCLGYFHEPEKSQFGLAFSVPQDHDKTPISLHLGITTFTRDTRPTLGQRFGIAYTVGYALMEWFLVDWVHKSISSHNVYFFQRTGQQGWDFSSPYLGGFEYARPAHEKSNEAFNHTGFHTNIYRHPARQGLPTEGFKKVHDIYAFGVLLLEIGLWTVASSRELFKDENQKPDVIKEILISNARGRLGHFMGERYRDAVLFCLEGTLQMVGDDEKQTKLIAAFKEKVLDVCEEGRGLL